MPSVQIGLLEGPTELWDKNDKAGWVTYTGTRSARIRRKCRARISRMTDGEREQWLEMKADARLSTSDKHSQDSLEWGEWAEVTQKRID